MYMNRNFINKTSKYGNKKVCIDGITFDSIKEANRYGELKLELKAKSISKLLRQCKFEIIPKSKTERAAFYVADFVYERDGITIAEDVKRIPHTGLQS